MISVGLVSLNTISKVKNFVQVAMSYDGDIELHSGRYVIDGKSIMGIFSIDLSKKVEMFVSEVESDSYKEFIDSCKPLNIF